MTDDRQQAVLVIIASQLESIRAQQAIKRSSVGYGRVSQPTALNVLKAKDHKISTLVEIADSLGCDVTIAITKRSA